MINAVLMLYGNHALHPWQEDMFPRLDLIQRDLRRFNLGFDIACVTHKPTGLDQLPSVRIAQEPIYDDKGVLLEANFKPGSIANYPVVIDHWVDNFQAEVIQSDGTIKRTAYGIGLPKERLVNHRNVQTFGNRKDKMQSLLQKLEVAIDTWNVGEIDLLTAKYGDHPVIFKPLGGSGSKGIEVFNSGAEFKLALETEKLANNGLIQPFFDTTQPLDGILPQSEQYAQQLKTANSQADRAREIRMYVMVTTDVNGQRQAKAYPVMKTSAPGTNHLPFYEWIFIHPDSFGPESYLYQQTIRAGLALAEATDVPHLYGCVDWVCVTPANQEHTKPHKQWLVVDFNCRGPGLAYQATAARQGFVELLVAMAGQSPL